MAETGPQDTRITVEEMFTAVILPGDEAGAGEKNYM